MEGVYALSDDKLSNIRKFVVERGGHLTLIKQTSNQLLNEIFTYTNTRLHISKKIKASPEFIFHSNL